MKTREIHRQTWVDQDKVKVFDFFANPDNLMKVTSDRIPVEILNDEEIIMKRGTTIDLKMKLFGFLPIQWRTEIAEWAPPDYFVDIQPKGPYRSWRHTHRFEEEDGGTLITDHVEYAVPGWIFEPTIHYLVVKRNLEQLFDYRQRKYPLLLDRSLQ